MRSITNEHRSASVPHFSNTLFQTDFHSDFLVIKDVAADNTRGYGKVCHGFAHAVYIRCCVSGRLGQN